MSSSSILMFLHTHVYIRHTHNVHMYATYMYRDHKNTTFVNSHTHNDDGISLIKSEILIIYGHLLSNTGKVLLLEYLEFGIL